MNRSWSDRLYRLLKSSHRNKPARPSRSVWQLNVEPLEDRCVPAIEILDSGTGSLDATFLVDGGTITAAQSTGTQTLSRSALTSIGSIFDISVTSDVITFDSLSSPLTLQTGLGSSASFTATTGAVGFAGTSDTLATSGGNLTLSAGTNLILANLSTTSGGSSGDVSLVAGTGVGGSVFAQGIGASNGNVNIQATNGGSVTQFGAASGSLFSVVATGNIGLDSVRGSTVTLISNAGSVSTINGHAIQSSTQLTLSAATGISVQTVATTLQATNSTSGNISVTQLGNPTPIQVLTTTGTGVTNGAAGGTITIDNLGSSITVASGANVTSNNGTVTLLGNDLQITGTVNAGTATAILGNSNTGTTIDVGTNSAGNIGLTQAELNNVTASVLQIGTNSAGSINVSAAITTPTSAPVVALVTNGNVTEGAAGSLALADLLVLANGSAALTNSTNNIGTIAAHTVGTFSVNNGTNTLTVGTVDGTAGVTTNDSTLTLRADNLLVQQAITPGTATAVLEPFTTSLNMTLGTASVSGTTFGLTDTELGWVSSGVTQVGTSADTGSIAITGAITRTATGTTRSQTLALVTGSTATNPLVSSTTGAITQTAALSVANLATNTVGGVQLTGGGNAIDTVAALITGTVTGADNFRLGDGTALTVGTVAGITGINAGSLQAVEIGTSGALTLTNGITAGGIGLGAGGAVTQGVAGALVATEAEFLGTGPYTLTAASNNIGSLAAHVTNAISFSNSGALTISSFNASDGFGGTVTGVSTTNAPITLSATGNLTIDDTINAGTGLVTLTATSIINGASSGTSDVIGGSLVANGFVTGVGTSATPLVTAVGTLGGTGAVGFFVTNTTALALNNIFETGGGAPIQVQTVGTAAGLNLTVNTGQTLNSINGNIVLTSAGNLTVNGTINNLSGHITLAGSNTTTGTTITLASSTVLNSTNVVQIQGTSAADTFDLVPQTAAALSVSGGAPTTVPGDVLNVIGDTGTTLTSTGVGAGTLAFSNGSGITFTGIETLNTATPIAVTLNLATLGFQQGSTSPDVVSVSTTAGGVLNVTVQENNTGTPVSIYSGLATGVSSLTVTGSTDPQTFIVDETNTGLPTVTVNGTGTANETLVVYTTNTTSPVFTPGAPRAGTVAFGNRNGITYTEIDNVATSIISVVASTPNAVVTRANQSPQPGTFTFTRTGNLSAALTVNYTVGGSAVNGSNYQALSGQVTFAAGSATATVNVSPTFTSVVGSTKTVDVTLAAGSGYAVLSPTSAEVTITNPNNELNNTFAVAGPTGVTVYRNGAPVLTNYNPGFTGPISVAVGDVTGDGVPDIVMAGLVNGTDWVAVIDGATLTLQNAFVPVYGYGGGLSLAVGDVFGIGHADIIVGLSTAPAYGIFDGQSDVIVDAVIVFPGANVGVNVATADLQGNGIYEIIATPTGIAPLVSIYNGSGTLLNRFFAFSPAIAGVGLTVAAGNLQNTGMDEIVLGVQVNGFAYAIVYNSNLTQRTILQLAAASSSAPPQVGTGSITGDGVPDLLVTTGGVVAAFDGDTLDLLTAFAPFPGQPGPIYVG